jgi:hypothetical protein
VNSKLSILMVCAIALGGCQTTAELAAEIEASWIGRPAEQLFLQAGPPIASFDLSSGGAIYTWSSGQEFRFETEPGMIAGSAIPTAGFVVLPEVHECRARITTDRNARIASIQYEPDSTVSMCFAAFRLPTV